jgi:hypothetical protein
MSVFNIMERCASNNKNVGKALTLSASRLRTALTWRGGFFCRPTFPDSSNPYEGLLSRTDVAFCFMPGVRAPIKLGVEFDP